MRDYFDHPFAIDAHGRVAVTTPDDHVRDLIWQVLFTAPGERVNRPDFGCGIQQLVFAPNSGALAAATQFIVHGSLQRWLSDRITVESVHITPENEVLTIEVTYVRRDTGQRHEDLFRSGSSAGGTA
jgi:phage baseplate assembly protein W